MAVTRDLPYSNSNFVVDFGVGNSKSETMGFAEVIFPPFNVDNSELRRDDLVAIQGIGTTNPAVDNRIILKRGFIGNLDLYNWWNKARKGKAPKRRTMKIELLSEDQTTVVLTWWFRNVCPVSLSYSPLRAIEGGIVMETVVLAFDGMEML
jgi:phage tail-like protein